jgi:hypothetical protein
MAPGFQSPDEPMQQWPLIDNQQAIFTFHPKLLMSALIKRYIDEI